MQFCPKCRLSMIPMKKEKAIVLACPKCGGVSRRSGPMVQKLGTARESVVVIGKEEEKSIQILPTMKVSCQKCGNGEAFYWMVQTEEAMKPRPSSSDVLNAVEHGESTHEMTT